MYTPSSALNLNNDKDVAYQLNPDDMITARIAIF